MAHTPGPWFEDIDPDYPEDRNGWIVGVVEYAGCGSHAAEWSSEDNKRLALAAPELLEACLWLKEYAEVQVRSHPDASDTKNWQSLLTAIAKATQP